MSPEEQVVLLIQLVIVVFALFAIAGRPSEHQIQQEQQTWDDMIVLDHEEISRRPYRDENPRQPSIEKG